MSFSILGQLFGLVNPEPRFEPSTAPPVVDPRVAALHPPTYYLKLAAQLRIRFEVSLRAIMYRYRVCEVEAYSSVILRKANRKGMRDGDVKDPVRDAFRMVIEEIVAEADSILDEEEVLPTMPGLEPRQALAVAAYLATYDSRYDYLFEDDAISQSSLGDADDADADLAPM